MREAAFQNLGIARRMGHYFFGGPPVPRSRMVGILPGLIKAEMTNQTMITIGAYDMDSRGAAELANSVATIWMAQRDASRPPVEVIAQARPPVKSMYPWVYPALWGIAVLAAILVGLLVGIIGAAVRACFVGTAPAPAVAPAKQTAAAGFTLIELLVVDCDYQHSRVAAAPRLVARQGRGGGNVLPEQRPADDGRSTSYTVTTPTFSRPTRMTGTSSRATTGVRARPASASRRSLIRIYLLTRNTAS